MPSSLPCKRTFMLHSIHFLLHGLHCTFRQSQEENREHVWYRVRNFTVVVLLMCWPKPQQNHAKSGELGKVPTDTRHCTFHLKAQSWGLWFWYWHNAISDHFPSELIMDPMCSSDSPLLGWICQLNYGCGGLLTLHDTSQHVPFSTSTLPLRIGQKVSFRIRFADKIEAVDLQVSSIQARDGLPAEHVSSSSQQSPTGNVIQEAARSCSGLQRQIRSLQRGILKFSNAAKVEQYQLVLEAERLLDKVLGQPDLDGDSLCQLIRRCASWLHAPIFKALAGDEPSLSDGQHPMNLQCRVRKLLIRALDHLDLSDRPTFEAVEAAMLHLHTLVQQVDLKLSSRTDRSSDSARQWLKLRELVRGSSSESSFPGSVVAYHGRQGVAPTTTLDVDFMESVTLCWITPGKQIELFST